ncbi:hypothetical protein K0U07_02400 [bacterium]|nr:hypothetical protein [bacterium]
MSGRIQLEAGGAGEVLYLSEDASLAGRVSAVLNKAVNTTIDEVRGLAERLIAIQGEEISSDKKATKMVKVVKKWSGIDLTGLCFPRLKEVALTIYSLSNNYDMAFQAVKKNMHMKRDLEAKEEELQLALCQLEALRLKTKEGGAEASQVANES